MKVYIAGPMTGYVEHNFPAFNAAAKRLDFLGFEAVNPAEMDDPNLTHEELAAIPHEVYMRRDIDALLDCDAIYLLPGWTHSKGASLEAQVAKGVGIPQIVDPDVEVWRTFEGEPFIEDASDCGCPHPKVAGCDHDDAPVDEDAPEWGVKTETDLAEVIRLHTLSGRVPQHDSFRPGDSFPNVAYVRDMRGITAAEFAENVQRMAEAGPSWDDLLNLLDGRGDQ